MITNYETQVIEQTRALYAKAMRLCKNEADAADLMQDTYIKALRSEAKYEEGTNLQAWLTTMMYRIFVNKYRRRKTLRRILEEKTSYLPMPEAHNAVDEMLAHRETEQLLEMLKNKINPNFFDVIYRVDALGMTYPECAAELGIPQGTVMSRLYRARRAAREILVMNYDPDELEKYVSKETLSECLELV